MEALARIFEWLREQEAGFSAVAAILVIAGVVFAGFRWLLSRRGEASAGHAPTGSAEARPTTDSSSADLDPLTVPGFEGRPAIAVLPFDNLSGDPEQEYFADGIAEDLITRLSAWRTFPVIARNSSFTYKGKAVDVKQVSRELGVRYVVEGSARKAGDQVRISAQLIDATTGAHVWADTYDRQLRDILSAQDELTEAIAGEAYPALIQSEGQRAASKDPHNLGAWDHQTRGLWHLGKETRENNLQAQGHFEKAVELEPGYAVAYAFLAVAHHQAIAAQWSASHEESVSLIEHAARRCMELDSTEAMCHIAMGILYMYKGQQAQAIAAYRRATELAPGAAWCYGLLGLILALAGQSAEALSSLEKAIRLSPRDHRLHIYLAAAGWAHFAAGHYQEAVEWLERSRQSKPDFNLAHRGLVSVYAILGRTEEARAALEEDLRLEPDITIEKVRLGLPFADPDFLERYFDGLRKAGLPE